MKYNNNDEYIKKQVEKIVMKEKMLKDVSSVEIISLNEDKSVNLIISGTNSDGIETKLDLTAFVE